MICFLFILFCFLFVSFVIFHSFEQQSDIQKPTIHYWYVSNYQNCQLQQIFMQNNSECGPNVRMNLFYACLSGYVTSSPQTSDIFTAHEILPLLLFVVPAMTPCPQPHECSHMKCPWAVGALAPWVKWQGPAGWTLKLPNTFTADSSGPAVLATLAVRAGHFS